MNHNFEVPMKRTTWYRFIRWVARYVGLAFFSGGMRVIGADHVPMDGPVILAPVHFSHFDPPVVSSASPRIVCFLAKEYLFRPPVLGPLIRSLNAFPIKQGAGDTSAIRLAIDKLQGGECLIMFPEGTRGDGKTLLPIQSGVALLAKKTGAQVVAVGINGTQKILPKGRSIPRFGRLCAVFGKPFRYADFACEDEKETRRRFDQHIEDELINACAEAGLDLKRPQKSEGR